jgi:hypothetical protein
MASYLKFSELSFQEQDRARARFINARPGDGYLYELDVDGHVLCRQKQRKISAAERKGRQMCPEWPHGPCGSYRTSGYSDEPYCIHADLYECGG